MNLHLPCILKHLILWSQVLVLTCRAFAGADQFANATVINTTKYRSPEISLLGFTNEPGEPDITNGFGDTTAWWRWTAPENGFCSVDSLNVPLNEPPESPVVGVFAGNSVSTLTKVISNSYSWKSGPTYNRALCTFYAVQGTTYHIVIDGADKPYVTASANRVILNLGLLPQPKPPLAIFSALESTILQRPSIRRPPTVLRHGSRWDG